MPPLVCQNCGANPATIHLTNIDDNEERIELNFCEECAAANGIASEVSLGVEFGAAVAAAAAARSTDSDLSCPHCGLTFAEFRRRGRLGCPMDYEVFRGPLEVMLRAEHDNHIRHRGRLPRGGRIEIQSTVNERLLHLRRELHQAVEAEDYEAAARIRDQIRAIESRPRELSSGAAGFDASWGEP